MSIVRIESKAMESVPCIFSGAEASCLKKSPAPMYFTGCYATTIVTIEISVTEIYKGPQFDAAVIRTKYFFAQVISTWIASTTIAFSL